MCGCLCVWMCGCVCGYGCVYVGGGCVYVYVWVCRCVCVRMCGCVYVLCKCVYVCEREIKAYTGPSLQSSHASTLTMIMEFQPAAVGAGEGGIVNCPAIWYVGLQFTSCYSQAL